MRCSAAVNVSAQGHRAGSRRVGRPLRLTSRPGMANRRRAMVAATVSLGGMPPMRAVQRAMLWANTANASHAALAAKRPDRLRNSQHRLTNPSRFGGSPRSGRVWFGCVGRGHAASLVWHVSHDAVVRYWRVSGGAMRRGCCGTPAVRLFLWTAAAIRLVVAVRQARWHRVGCVWMRWMSLGCAVRTCGLGWVCWLGPSRGSRR